MSIIKQKSVTTSLHGEHIRDYINDKEALIRDGQFISLDNWYEEMAQTREDFGHNNPARGGSKNTIMYHQVIAFLPEEIDINGGNLTPELCMKYAWEYIYKRYPNQQIAIALHKEFSPASGVYRYAAHMAINRTDLETGKRLDEGKSKYAKIDRANSIRDLDRKWNLQQVVAGEVNSKLHHRQESELEKKIKERGGTSIKNNIRELVSFAAEKATSIDELRKFLRDFGITTRIKNDKVYATADKNTKYNFLISKLDGAYSNEGLQSIFDANKKSKAAQAQETPISKEQYKEALLDRYKEYIKVASEHQGTDYNDFPKLKLPRPSDELRKDPDVQMSILSYVKKGDELRYKMSSNKPLAKATGSRTDSSGHTDINQKNTGIEKTHEKGKER